MGQWADTAGTPASNPTGVMRSKSKSRQSGRPKRGQWVIKKAKKKNLMNENLFIKK